MSYSPRPGDRFDTPFETGCVVTSEIHDDGFETPYFMALDSEGVECSFIPAMVIRWDRPKETS